MIILSAQGYTAFFTLLTVLANLSTLAHGFAIPAAFKHLYSSHSISSNADTNQRSLSRRSEHLTWGVNNITKERVLLEKIYVDPSTNDWFKGKGNPWKKYQDQRNAKNKQATQLYANVTKDMKGLADKADVAKEIKQLVDGSAKDVLVSIEESNPEYYITTKEALQAAPRKHGQPTSHSHHATLEKIDTEHALKVPTYPDLIIPDRSRTKAVPIDTTQPSRRDFWRKVDMPWHWPPPEVLQLGMTVLKPLHDNKIVLVGYGDEDSAFDRLPVQKIIISGTVGKFYKGFRESDFREIAGVVGTRVMRNIVVQNWVLVGRRESGIANISFVDDERYVSESDGKSGEEQEKSGEKQEKRRESREKSEEPQGQNVTVSDIVHSANNTSTEEKVDIEGEIKQDVTVENDNATLPQAGEKKDEFASTKFKKRGEEEESKHTPEFQELKTALEEKIISLQSSQTKLDPPPPKWAPLS